MKHFISHKALQSLYYALIHSHVTYVIQAWGNGNTRKLKISQQRALRIINNRGYRSHANPIFKSEKILKVLDVYKLQVLLFIHDFHHDVLPKSLKKLLSTRIWIKVLE